MFGAQYFGGLIFGVAVAVAPLAAPIIPGADGGGFGTQYFGQYWPQVYIEPVPGTAGGGLGSIYFGQYWPGTQFDPPVPPPLPLLDGSIFYVFVETPDQGVLVQAEQLYLVLVSLDLCLFYVRPALSSFAVTSSPQSVLVTQEVEWEI